jgi:DNA polymerase-3 subunit epsilon
MTRGQDSLVIESRESATSGPGVPMIELREFVLLAIEVPDEERIAHDVVLADLDKASAGQTLWRRLA